LVDKEAKENKMIKTQTIDGLAEEYKQWVKNGYGRVWIRDASGRWSASINPTWKIHNQSTYYIVDDEDAKIRKIFADGGTILAKSKTSGDIVRFYDLCVGEVVASHKLLLSTFIPVTDSDQWEILPDAKQVPSNIYKDILPIPKASRYCCWVHENNGYFAYCHKDGRLITRTGHSGHTDRTWSSVGADVLDRVLSEIEEAAL
jgi:hypothetical protein